MFEETPSPDSIQPVSGPPPGRPIQPFGVPSYGATPPPPSSVSPEGMRPIPPPTVPPSVPPRRSPGGGSRKRILLITVLVVVLLAGGAAVAALVFPNLVPSTDNTNTVANANANTNGNANVNRAANVNRTNVNTNTRVNTNTNTNAVANVNVTNTALPNLNANAGLNTNAATNQNTNATNQAANQNTNATANVNAVVNTNTATNTPVNTNTPPETYTNDTDGDKLNDYLEEWVGTSKTNPDSDSDGFPDGSEVLSKYSPLGAGDMTAAGFQTFCVQSTVVRQYGLSSTDVTTLCGIGADILANIQVMASNADFYEDLTSQLTGSCGSFGKVDSKVCVGLTAFLLVDYLVSS